MTNEINKQIEELQAEITEIVYLIEALPEARKDRFACFADIEERAERKLDELSGKLAAIDPAYKASLEA